MSSNDTSTISRCWRRNVETWIESLSEMRWPLSERALIGRMDSRASKRVLILPLKLVLVLPPREIPCNCPLGILAINVFSDVMLLDEKIRSIERYLRFWDWKMNEANEAALDALMRFPFHSRTDNIGMAGSVDICS